jgi:hypothetical protein
MNVSIVKEDRVVMVDGEGINFDFVLADNIWAVQWNGTSGEVEHNDGTANREITDFAEFQGLVDGYNTEKKKLEDAAIEAEATRISNMTYAQKRAAEYPSLEAQADMQYWDAVNGTTTWVDAITAVKEKHPK